MAESQGSSSSNASTMLYVAAALVAAAPLVRGFTGYYDSDLVWMLPMLVVAGALALAANRLAP